MLIFWAWILDTLCKTCNGQSLNQLQHQVILGIDNLGRRPHPQIWKRWGFPAYVIRAALSENPVSVVKLFKDHDAYEGSAAPDIKLPKESMSWMWDSKKAWTKSTIILCKFMHLSHGCEPANSSSGIPERKLQELESKHKQEHREKIRMSILHLGSCSSIDVSKSESNCQVAWKTDIVSSRSIWCDPKSDSEGGEILQVELLLEITVVVFRVCGLCQPGHILR